MSEKTKTKGKKTWLYVVFTILAVIIVTGGIVIYLRISQNAEAQATIQGLDTVVYGTGSLSASISGTGTVRADQIATLAWNTSGTVGDVMVALGQPVKNGQGLVALDESSLPIDILQAQIDKTNAEKSLEDLYNNAGLQLAQVQLDLITAEKNLDDMATDRAIMNYQRCTDERTEELQDEYDDALSMHDRFPNAQTLQAVDTALANLNYCLAGYTEEEVAEAEARVTLAEERVADLKLKVETLKDGPDPKDVTVLETRLAIAKARLAKQVVEAPFDGIVTALYIQQGDVVSAGMKAVQLANLSELYLDVQISEVDIPLVKIGQNAELVFDAYFEDTYKGEVTEIAPIGTEIQGVVTYTVTVKMLDGVDTIKSGMTAAVNIITEEKTGVYILPNEAVTTVDGVDTVYVLREGVPVAVEVTVGVYSDTDIEILAGDIQDGELIVINPPTSLLGSMTEGGFPGGGSMPGFIGGH